MSRSVSHSHKDTRNSLSCSKLVSMGCVISSTFNKQLCLVLLILVIQEPLKTLLLSSKSSKGLCVALSEFVVDLMSSLNKLGGGYVVVSR